MSRDDWALLAIALVSVASYALMGWVALQVLTQIIGGAA